MTRASRTSWKTLPPPQQRESLGFEAVLDHAATELLMLGLVPAGMEDKWFIHFEQGWLYLHRSWTGACIYGVQLERSPGGARVVDSWVSRDPTQYKGTDLDYDRKLLRFLIDVLLLRRPAVFPLPAGVEAAAPPGLYQHAVVGRAYPESPPEPPFVPAQSRAK